MYSREATVGLLGRITIGLEGEITGGLKGWGNNSRLG
jgi:hypothetical protein